MTKSSGTPSVLDQLAVYAPQERPGAVVHALRQLAKRASRDLILIARLAYEAHEGGYWSKVNKVDGGAYRSEEEFVTDVMDVMSWRTAMKRIALGRALAALPESARDRTAQRLADLGVTRATILVPVLEMAPDMTDTWIAKATTCDVGALQAAVSQTLGTARQRPETDRDRVAVFLARVMPDIESRTLLDDFLRIGRRVTQSNNTLGVLIVAMQECLGTWRPSLGDVGQ